MLHLTGKDTKNFISIFLIKYYHILNGSKTENISLQNNQSMSHSNIYSSIKETLFHKIPVGRAICTLHSYNKI